jgi:hypothetical protein
LDNIPAILVYLVAAFFAPIGLARLVIPVTLTAPSIVYSSLIYLIGGYFKEPIAMIIAALVGTVVIYVALSGSWPADMKFPLSITWKIALTAIYALCWIAVCKFPPRFV